MKKPIKEAHIDQDVREFILIGNIELRIYASEARQKVELLRKHAGSVSPITFIMELVILEYLLEKVETLSWDLTQLNKVAGQDNLKPYHNIRRELARQNQWLHKSKSNYGL